MNLYYNYMDTGLLENMELLITIFVNNIEFIYTYLNNSSGDMLVLSEVLVTNVISGGLNNSDNEKDSDFTEITEDMNTVSKLINEEFNKVKDEDAMLQLFGTIYKAMHLDYKTDEKFTVFVDKHLLICTIAKFQHKVGGLYTMDMVVDKNGRSKLNEIKKSNEKLKNQLVFSMFQYYSKNNEITLLKDIVSNLENNFKLETIHIIILGWDYFYNMANMTNPDDINYYVTEEIKGKFLGFDNIGNNILLKIHRFNYINFFANLEDILFSENNSRYPWTMENKDRGKVKISPIIIFKGITKNNIINLFQHKGYTLHGGSISRRHLLSIIEYRLSLFLYISGLVQYKSELYSSHNSEFIIKNKYKKIFKNNE